MNNNLKELVLKYLDDNNVKNNIECSYDNLNKSHTLYDYIYYILKNQTSNTDNIINYINNNIPQNNLLLVPNKNNNFTIFYL